MLFGGRTWAVLQKLRTRNCVEVAPFLDIIELNNRLIVANSQLLSEREEIQFINVKLKEETQKLRLLEIAKLQI